MAFLVASEFQVECVKVDNEVFSGWVYFLIFILFVLSFKSPRSCELGSQLNNYQQIEDRMCADLSEEEEKYFCYLIIKQYVEAWIGLGLGLLATVLALVGSFQFHKARSLNMLNLSVKLIYLSIFLWAAVYLAKIVTAEILFWEQISQLQSEDVYHFYSIASKYSLIIDISGVFLVQTILVLVCYNWVNDLVKKMVYLEGGDVEKVDVAYLKYEIICQKLLKLYLVVRFFFYLLIIPFISVSEPGQENIMAKIMLILLLVEALFVFVILCIGLTLIKRNKKINELVSSTDISLMVNRYMILTICTVIRLALDIIFVSYNFSKLTGSKCYINDIKPGLETRNIMDFILGGVFTHCLPIYIVLRIYDVKREDVSLSQSLIAAESYTNSYKQNQSVQF